MRRPAFERQRHSTLSKYHCAALEPYWGGYSCEQANLVQCSNCYAYQIGNHPPKYPVPAIPCEYHWHYTPDSAIGLPAIWHLARKDNHPDMYAETWHVYANGDGSHWKRDGFTRLI